MKPLDLYTTYYKDEVGITESVLLNVLSDLIDCHYSHIVCITRHEEKAITLSLQQSIHSAITDSSIKKASIELIKNLINLAIEKRVYILREGFSGGSIAASGELIKYCEFIVLIYEDEKVIECLMKNNL